MYSLYSFIDTWFDSENRFLQCTFYSLYIRYIFSIRKISIFLQKSNIYIYLSTLCSTVRIDYSFLRRILCLLYIRHIFSIRKCLDIPSKIYIYLSTLCLTMRIDYFFLQRALCSYIRHIFLIRESILKILVYLSTLWARTNYSSLRSCRKNWSYIRFSGDDWRQIDINIPLFTRSFLEKQKYTSFSWSTSNFVFRSLRMRTWQGPQGAIDTEVGFTYIPLHVATTA